MPATPQLAVVVTTFQMPGHLRLCLESIRQQSTGCPFEVVVADDGSRDETAAVVRQFAGTAPFPVRFVTHDHAGFQAARCRNNGVRHSAAEHFVFVDGDCILPPDHIETHLRAHRPGTVTSGYCVRLTQETSQQIDFAAIKRGGLERYATAGELRKLATMHRKAWWYGLLNHPTKPALRSTDFSIARTDFEQINGFDEQFRGWGGEDDDLGRRLKSAGVGQVSVLDKTRVYHLWHPPVPSKTVQWRDGANIDYLQRPLRLTRCLAGLKQRTLRDLTVRIAGEPGNAAALNRLIRSQGWRLQCDAGIRADLELLPWPGRGRFRSQGDCWVLVLLEDAARLPWCARRAHAVVSATETDIAALWQLLSAERNCSPSALVEQSKHQPAIDAAGRAALASYGPGPIGNLSCATSSSFVSSPS